MGYSHREVIQSRDMMSGAVMGVDWAEGYVPNRLVNSPFQNISVTYFADTTRTKRRSKVVILIFCALF